MSRYRVVVGGAHSPAAAGSRGGSRTSDGSTPRSRASLDRDRIGSARTRAAQRRLPWEMVQTGVPAQRVTLPRWKGTASARRRCSSPTCRGSQRIWVAATALARAVRHSVDDPDGARANRGLREKRGRSRASASLERSLLDPVRRGGLRALQEVSKNACRPSWRRAGAFGDRDAGSGPAAKGKPRTAAKADAAPQRKPDAGRPECAQPPRAS